MSGDIYKFMLDVSGASAAQMFLDVAVEDLWLLGGRRFHIRYDENALAFLESAVDLLRQNAEGKQPTAEPEDLMAMLHATLERKIDADVFYGGHERNGKEY